MEFELKAYLDPEQCSHELMTAIYNRAIQENISPSHDIHHINSVLHYAWTLFNSIPSNSQISWQRIFIAACLHDLGRNNPMLHKGESLAESIKLAGKMLDELNVPTVEIDAILEIISQHDQPDLDPETFEALILKEADFLAGMGTTGILRTILWAGECGRTIPQIVQILSEKMPARISSLQLPFSRKRAAELWPKSLVFLAEFIEEQKGVETEIFTGKLIVFEGISGAGKGTQIEILKQKLEQAQREVVVLAEPSDHFRDTLERWKMAKGTATELERKYLLMADRVAEAERIKELLRNGVTVILDRSYISTMVYQGRDHPGMATVLQSHTEFFPLPDIVFLLDVDAQIALDRIDTSLDRGERPIRGDYERIDLLQAKRQLYRHALELLPKSIPCITLNASQSIDAMTLVVRQELTEQDIIELT